MKIGMEIQKTVTFSAIHIADTYNNGTKNLIKIYKLNDKDSSFLKNLQKNTFMKNFMPTMNEEKLNVWQKIFTLSVQNADSTSKTGFVAFYNGKPCGIMAYTKKTASYKLDTICTWPVEQGKKVPFAGKTLLSLLFADFLKSKAYFIDLNAVTNAPFSAVSKYMSLGFKQRGGENGIIAMRIGKDEVTKTMSELNEKIKIIPQSSTKEIDLNNPQV